MGGDGEGTHCICITPLPVYLIKVSGASYCGRGRQLDGSGAQPQACQTEVVASDSDIEKIESG